MTDADKKLYDKAVEALDQLGAGLPSEIEKYVPAWIDGYLEGLKVKINTTTISDCPIKDKWHKADVPTSPINKVVLGYIKHYNSKRFCLVEWNGKWWYDARTYNDRVKLIAWCEIPQYTEE